VAIRPAGTLHKVVMSSAVLSSARAAATPARAADAGKSAIFIGGSSALRD
jgi:hypothetical protein